MSQRIYANIYGITLPDLRVSPRIPELDGDRCASCKHENRQMDTEPCRSCLDQVSRGYGYTGYKPKAGRCCS